MSAQIPIPRGGMSLPSEMSALAPYRESGSMSKLWQPVAAQGRRDLNNTNNNGALARHLNRVGQKIDRIPSILFPFKIYQLPFMFQSGADPASAWRTFRVRAGFVFPSGAGGILPTGTDGVTNPDIETYFDQATTAQANAIVADDNTLQFWIWINVASSTSASIQASATPATATVPWTGFPTPSSTNIPIGYIDTQTMRGQGTAIVRQILRYDSLGIGSGGLSSAYYLKSYANYWLCETAVGNGVHARVAKPPELRNSILTETIYGQTFTYNYLHNSGTNSLYGIYRTSTRSSDGFLEYQGVNPQPQAGYILYLASFPTGLKVEAQDVTDNPGDNVVAGTTPITYLDNTNSGRAWWANNDQSYGN